MRFLLAFLLAPSLAYAQEPVDAPPAPPPPTPRDECLANRRVMQEKAMATADLAERTRLLRALPACGSTSQPPTETTSIVEGAPDPIASGFVIEARLDGSYAFTADFVVPTAQPGIFLGYRGSAISAGIGLELVRLTTSAEGAGMVANSDRTSLLIIPGIRVRFTRTADGQTELLGLFDFGLGSAWSSTTGTAMSTESPTPLNLRVQVGLTPRHWLTRSFALGAAIGVRYDYSTVTDETLPNASIDRTASGLSMFSSLQMLAVF